MFITSSCFKRKLAGAIVVEIAKVPEREDNGQLEVNVEPLQRRHFPMKPSWEQVPQNAQQAASGERP
jgi:hypothetical protein